MRAQSHFKVLMHDEESLTKSNDDSKLTELAPPVVTFLPATSADKLLLCFFPSFLLFLKAVGSLVRAAAGC